MKKEIVRTSLGARSYDIHIADGLLETAGDLLKPLLKRPRVVVVTDENVITAQGDRLKGGLTSADVDATFITLKPGEATKSFSQLEALTAQLLTLGVERDDMIVAFGGGVIGDLTGFAAAILRRGCRFAQIPTTLLAQVDSAVGGKTAINTLQGKNLVGAFHQPEIVISDVGALRTLPDRELRAGYAEVVKYGLISDPAFFTWLEEHGVALLNGDVAAQVHAVKVSCERKAAIVSADEHEKGQRALLNLGHTFGHAFEASFGYSDQLLHGEGVALGMALAFEYSARQGLCPDQTPDRIKAHLKQTGLPCEISDLNASLSAKELLAYMMQDKKVEQGAITLILAEDIGRAVIVKDADANDITVFLKERTGS